MDRKSNFWLENPESLLKKLDILPTVNMDIDDRMNAITRLVILVSVLLYLNKHKQWNLFFILSLITIIIFYYINKERAMNNTSHDTKPTIEHYQDTNINYKYGIDDGINYTSNPGYKVKNVEKDKKYTSFYSKGYKEIETNDNYLSYNQQLAGPPNPKTKIAPVVVTPMYDVTRRNSELNVPSHINSRRTQYLADSGYLVKEIPKRERRENFTDIPTYLNPKDTQYLGPNTYAKNFNDSQFSSNIGISYQTPSFKRVEKIDNVYLDTETPYNVLEPNIYDDCEGTAPDQVYDPRFTGYGSHERAYIDPLLGQTRFMYKDIDAMRRGNMFIRSNIDHLPFSQQNGVMQDRVYTNVKDEVDMAYVDSNSQFRESLQQRLMSKNNDRIAQLRKFPITKHRR